MDRLVGARLRNLDADSRIGDFRNEAGEPLEGNPRPPGFQCIWIQPTSPRSPKRVASKNSLWCIVTAGYGS